MSLRSLMVRRRCFFAALIGGRCSSVSTLPSVWTHSNVPTLPILFDYSHSVQGVTTRRLRTYYFFDKYTTLPIDLLFGILYPRLALGPLALSLPGLPFQAERIDSGRGSPAGHR